MYQPPHSLMTNVQFTPEKLFHKLGQLSTYSTQIPIEFDWKKKYVFVGLRSYLLFLFFFFFFCVVGGDGGHTPLAVYMMKYPTKGCKHNFIAN